MYTMSAPLYRMPSGADVHKSEIVEPIVKPRRRKYVYLYACIYALYTMIYMYIYVYIYYIYTRVSICEAYTADVGLVASGNCMRHEIASVDRRIPCYLSRRMSPILNNELC